MFILSTELGLSNYLKKNFIFFIQNHNVNLETKKIKKNCGIGIIQIIFNIY